MVFPERVVFPEDVIPYKFYCTLQQGSRAHGINMCYFIALYYIPLEEDLYHWFVNFPPGSSEEVIHTKHYRCHKSNYTPSDVPNGLWELLARGRANIWPDEVAKRIELPPCAKVGCSSPTCARSYMLLEYHPLLILGWPTSWGVWVLTPMSNCLNKSSRTA